MKKQTLGYFYSRLLNKKQQFPLSGQVELTYRCNLNCIYCYCKGSEDKENELKTQEWKRILDVIHKEGCLWLTFTGGDPLIRKDFLEIYSYAKSKGFLISIFSNGQLFTEEIINYLSKSPPCSIEITLNGITQNTYETITQVKGSFYRVMNVIRKLAKTDLPVNIKTNCLKQNKHEIGRIKAFTEELFGKPAKNKYRFRYDPMLFPRLNGDTTPCNYRLSWEDLLDVKKQDPDIWEEHQRSLHIAPPSLEREKIFTYRCNFWLNKFFINPYGRLKFCSFSDKFSVDLKKASFNYGFYKIFPQLLGVRFKTDSKCQNCHLRITCYHCPARAFLERGNEEAPVEYFCKLAETTQREMSQK